MAQAGGKKRLGKNLKQSVSILDQSKLRRARMNRG